VPSPTKCVIRTSADKRSLNDPELTAVWLDLGVRRRRRAAARPIDRHVACWAGHDHRVHLDRDVSVLRPQGPGAGITVRPRLDLLGVRPLRPAVQVRGRGAAPAPWTVEGLCPGSPSRRGAAIARRRPWVSLLRNRSSTTACTTPVRHHDLTPGYRSHGQPRPFTHAFARRGGLIDGLASTLASGKLASDAAHPGRRSPPYCAAPDVLW
jgi:hypothetical protein